MKQKLYLSFFVWVFFCVCNLSAQNEPYKKNEFYKSIAFDERIDFGNVDPSTSWRILKPDGTIQSFKGSELNNYVFHIPGVYEITHKAKTAHSETCSHAHLPETARIFVSSIKMRYELSNVKFSRPLALGSCDGIIVTVPVTVESFTKKSEPYVPGILEITGIGTNAQGVLVKGKNLMSNNGKQELTYALKGTLGQAGYVMLDFYDCNQNTQTFYLPEPIH